MSKARFQERVTAALAAKLGVEQPFKEPAKPAKGVAKGKNNAPQDIQSQQTVPVTQGPLEPVVKKERKQRKRKTGTRQEVWDGVCEKTPGGLTKADLIQRPGSSAIMSKKKHEMGKLYAANMRAPNPQ